MERCYKQYIDLLEEKAKYAQNQDVSDAYLIAKQYFIEIFEEWINLNL